MSQSAHSEKEKDNARSPSVCVIVGDPSADQHVSKLIERLKSAVPQLSLFGIGGDEMERAGAELLYNCQTFAAVGIIRLINKVPMFAGIRSDMLQKIEERRPSCLLLVDFGGFNIGFAEAARKRFPDLPIVYFISPQVWGSRPWRLNALARSVSKMLVIFPFEEAIYRNRQIPARFVGHPLTQNLEKFESPVDRTSFASAHGLSADRPIIAIFPGSRRQEIKDHVPPVIEAVKWLNSERPDMQFVISQANDAMSLLIRDLVGRSGVDDPASVNLTFLSQSENYNLLKIADLAWAKSGTTTLETTLCGTPMIIFYRGDWLSYMLVLIFKTVKRIGWPNLLAGYDLVPELIQLDCRAEQLVRYTKDLIDVPQLREEMSSRLKSLRVELGQGDFTENAAFELLEIIGCSEQKKATASKMGLSKTH